MVHKKVMTEKGSIAVISFLLMTIGIQRITMGTDWVYFIQGLTFILIGGMLWFLREYLKGNRWNEMLREHRIRV